MDQDRVPAVSVVVPCFNEEEALPSLLRRLRAMHDRAEISGWEFVFVDDGSTDGTLALLLQAERDTPWVRVVRHSENLGLGEALRTGFAHCAAPIVCSLDSDATYPPEELPKLVDMIENGFDVATASVWHPENDTAEGSRFRLWLSWSLSRVYQALVGQDVHTFTCLFRAYRREALHKTIFRASGFSSVAEIMLAAIRENYRIAEIPMPIEPRRYGQSKMRLRDAVGAHLSLLLQTAASAGVRRLSRQE